MLGHGESDKEALPRVVEALLGRDIVEFALGSKHMMAVSGECTPVSCLINNEERKCRCKYIVNAIHHLWQAQVKLTK